MSSKYKSKILPSKSHISEVPIVDADLSFDDVDVKKFDAVVFVGGNGAWNEFLPNPLAAKILLDSVKFNKVTALICAATGLLATADNLDGLTPHFKNRHVTGFYEVAGLLEKLGQVQYDKGDKGKPLVVRDGKLITARDPLSASLFGETIKSILKNGE